MAGNPSGIAVSFAGEEIPPGDYVSIRQAQRSPIVSFEPTAPDQLYTIIIYDPDAPYPQNRAQSPYLHWLVTNIYIGEDGKWYGSETVAYAPPSPPEDSPPHRYHIEVFEQLGTIYVDPPIEERSNFDLQQFAYQHKLLPLYITFFMSGAERKALKGNYIKRNSPLTAKQRAYCRCVLHVAAQNTRKCNQSQNWGNGCYNPYAVCAASVGERAEECGQYYNLEAIPDNELIALADLRGVRIRGHYDRQRLIRAIRQSEAK